MVTFDGLGRVRLPGMYNRDRDNPRALNPRAVTL